jgi:membrane-associated phospholipid phosphatase
VAFAVVTVLVVLGTFATADRAILDFVQRPHAEWLDAAAGFVTYFGQSEVVGSIALGVAIVRWRHGRRDWWIPLLLLLVVAIELVLKQTVPQEAPPGELIRNYQPSPFIDAPTAYAYPSGHMARVAFLVTALRWPAGASAVILVVMGLTRIYLAQHWPSEVVGGWLLGYGIAAVAQRPPRILLRK